MVVYDHISLQLERSDLFFGDEVAKTILDLVCTFRKAREVAVQLCEKRFAICISHLYS